MIDYTISEIIYHYGFMILSAIVLLVLVMIYSKISDYFFELLFNYKTLAVAVLYIITADNLGKSGDLWNTYTNKFGTWEIKRIKQNPTTDGVNDGII